MSSTSRKATPLKTLQIVGAFAAGCLGLVALLVLIVVLEVIDHQANSDYEPPPPSQAFDSCVWKEQGEAGYLDEWPLRLLMVDSLLAMEVLDELNYAQVEALLGPPTYISVEALDGEYTIDYLLGDERSYFRIDSELLSVTFSKEDVVNRAWSWRD